MQSVTRRPAQSLCIFCALRATARSLTTSSPLHREQRKKQKRPVEPRFNPRDSRIDNFPGIHNRRESFQPANDRFTVRRGSGLTAAEELQFAINPKGRRNGDLNFAPGNRGLARKGQPRRLVDDRIKKVINDLRNTCTQDKILARLHLRKDQLQKKFDEFADDLEDQLDNGPKGDSLLMELRRSADKGDVKSIERYARMAVYSSILTKRFSQQDLQQQSREANLQYPSEWFPATRGRRREIHLHVGPTNSGKTYHALKRLEQANKGLYAGPLRLLAHEVYMRLNASGKRCNLVTGDERRTSDDDPKAPMTACTVEMVPLNSFMDVAVIDEIQVIGSEDRGWAWTQALLGVQASEVHLCGEERAVPIVKEIVALCGEKLHIHKYERLSPLKMSKSSLDGNIRNLQKGDCIVAFSVVAIHGLRQLIEKTLGCSVAVIYGSLPPETRAQQARLFNDPTNNYDILVASDAVGMGLNLSIKRMIFQSSFKIHGNNFTELYVHEVKQIAGRAGRYSTAEADMKTDTIKKEDGLSITKTPVIAGAVEPVSPAPAPRKSVGLVTTLEAMDFPVIERLMEAEPMPITSAGLLPPSYLIERFVRYFPIGTPFSFLLNRLHEIASTNSRFHLCDLRQQVGIADAIEDVEDLSTNDRIVFCSSPADMRKPGEPELINKFAQCVAKGVGLAILDVPELDLDLLGEEYTANRSYLQQIEKLHKGIVIWMWLSYRFRAIFTERELAIHVKELTETRIADTLEKLSFDFSKMKKKREQAISELLKREQAREEATRAGGAKKAQGLARKDLDAYAARRKLIEDVEDASEELPVDRVPDAGEEEDKAQQPERERDVSLSSAIDTSIPPPPTLARSEAKEAT